RTPRVAGIAPAELEVGSEHRLGLGAVGDRQTDVRLTEVRLHAGEVFACADRRLAKLVERARLPSVARTRLVPAETLGDRSGSELIDEARRPDQHRVVALI